MYSELDLKRAAQIIVKIARENKMSEGRVRADMKEAMEAGRNDPNPIVQAQWEEFQFVGKEPTIVGAGTSHRQYSFSLAKSGHFLHV